MRRFTKGSAQLSQFRQVPVGVGAIRRWHSRHVEHLGAFQQMFARPDPPLRGDATCEIASPPVAREIGIREEISCIEGRPGEVFRVQRAKVFFQRRIADGHSIGRVRINVSQNLGMRSRSRNKELPGPYCKSPIAQSHDQSRHPTERESGQWQSYRRLT